MLDDVLKVLSRYLLPFSDIEKIREGTESALPPPQWVRVNPCIVSFVEGGAGKGKE